MKRNLLISAMLLIGVSTYAQKDNVGIGTTKPDQSAALDVSSSNKGLLIPRMSLQQRSAIQNPAQGLMVYQSDFISGFYYYDGKEWKNMGANTAENSVAGTDGDWALAGNNLATDPLSPGVANAFIGTVSGGGDVLRFKVDGVSAGSISTGSNLFLGYRSGLLAGSGNGNLGIGNSSLSSLTTGYSNTAIGADALRNDTEGQLNVAIGGSALKANLTGFGNVSIGGSSMLTNTAGNNNIAIGADALYTSTTSNNIAIGRGALVSQSSGSGNVAIGYQAGNDLSSGSNNLFIGNYAGFSEGASNKLYISNVNTTTPLVYGDFSAKFIAIGDITASVAKRDGLATQYGLLVQKGILTEKIKVATLTSTDWSDYVFEDTYKRMPLEDVEKFVKENKHLPNVPTTQDMIANGNDLIKTDAKLLEKIEELTLYLIEINKEVKELKKENVELKKKVFNY